MLTLYKWLKTHYFIDITQKRGQQENTITGNRSTHTLSAALVLCGRIALDDSIKNAV